LGVVQPNEDLNQRFSGPHSRQFAPGPASSEKNPAKIIKKVVGNGEKWRFFEGLKRHFGVLGADRARSETASLPDLTPVESPSIEPPPTPPISNGAPFFTEWGTDRQV